MIAFTALFLAGILLCVNKHPIWGAVTIVASLLSLLALL